MIRCDYYFFQVFASNVSTRDIKARTLRKAKQAFMRCHRFGMRMTSSIIGCSFKENSPFITYTPFFEDTNDFGRTERTCAGIRHERELEKQHKV